MSSSEHRSNNSPSLKGLWRLNKAAHAQHEGAAGHRLAELGWAQTLDSPHSAHAPALAT